MQKLRRRNGFQRRRLRLDRMPRLLQIRGESLLTVKRLKCSWGYGFYHGWRKRANGSNQWCGHRLYQSTNPDLGCHCKTCGDSDIKTNQPFAYSLSYYDDKNPTRIKRRGSPPKPPAPKESALFRKMNTRSKHWGESNDCTVKATAIACGITYEEAHGALALRGRNYRKGVTPGKYHAAIKSFGFKLERLPHIKDFPNPEDGRYGKINAKLKHPLSKVKTVGKLKDALPKRGIFLVGTNSHVFCARAGKMHDWTASTRRQRITSIYRIERAPTEEKT